MQKSFRDLIINNAEIVQSSVHQDSSNFQTVDQLQSFQQVTVHGDPGSSPKLGDPGSGGPLSASSDKSKSWFLAGGDGDSKSSSSGASTSSKSGGGVAAALAKTDFPWHLSVQAAFQIAKIPAPPLERLLPVGTFNPPPLSPTVKSPGSRGNEYPYESQESSMTTGNNMISLGQCNRFLHNV